MVEFRGIPLQKWKIRYVLQSSSAESRAVRSTAMDLDYPHCYCLQQLTLFLLLQNEGLLPVKSGFIH